jgi:hypothetical protein
MSNDANIDNDDSIAAVAARRRAAPGVVDREPVLRLYDRLQHPLPTSALADRLHQRAAHAEQADGSALVWQRTSIASNAFVSEPPPSPDVGHATTPSVQRPPPAQRTFAAVPVNTTPAPAFVQRLARRQQVPKTAAIADSVAQAAAESPAIAKDSLSTQVHTSYGVETGASVPPSHTTTPIRTTSAPVSVMRQVDSTITRHTQQTPPASTVNRASIPARADVAALPSVARHTSLPISTARKHDVSAAPRCGMPAETARTVSISTDATSTIAAARSAPAITLAPPSSSAATPLVLRRVAAPVPTSPPSPPVPYAMPSSSAAEDPAHAAQAVGAANAPHVAAAVAQGGHADIDRIAEEVERRLRLRLEIERERRGIRSWR